MQPDRIQVSNGEEIRTSIRPYDDEWLGQHQHREQQQQQVPQQQVQEEEEQQQKYKTGTMQPDRIQFSNGEVIRTSIKPYDDEWLGLQQHRLEQQQQHQQQQQKYNNRVQASTNPFDEPTDDKPSVVRKTKSTNPFDESDEEIRDRDVLKDDKRSVTTKSKTTNVPDAFSLSLETVSRSEYETAFLECGISMTPSEKTESLSSHRRRYNIKEHPLVFRDDISSYNGSRRASDVSATSSRRTQENIIKHEGNIHDATIVGGVLQPGATVVLLRKDCSTEKSDYGVLEPQDSNLKFDRLRVEETDDMVDVVVVPPTPSPAQQSKGYISQETSEVDAPPKPPRVISQQELDEEVTSPGTPNMSSTPLTTIERRAKTAEQNGRKISKPTPFTMEDLENDVIVKSAQPTPHRHPGSPIHVLNQAHSRRSSGDILGESFNRSRKSTVTDIDWFAAFNMKEPNKSPRSPICNNVDVMKEVQNAVNERKFNYKERRSSLPLAPCVINLDDIFKKSSVLKEKKCSCNACEVTPMTEKERIHQHSRKKSAESLGPRRYTFSDSPKPTLFIPLDEVFEPKSKKTSTLEAQVSCEENTQSQPNAPLSSNTVEHSNNLTGASRTLGSNSVLHGLSHDDSRESTKYITGITEDVETSSITSSSSNDGDASSFMIGRTSTLHPKLAEMSNTTQTGSYGSEDSAICIDDIFISHPSQPNCQEIDSQAEKINERSELEFGHNNPKVHTNTARTTLPITEISMDEIFGVNEGNIPYKVRNPNDQDQQQNNDLRELIENDSMHSNASGKPPFGSGDERTMEWNETRSCGGTNRSLERTVVIRSNRIVSDVTNESNFQRAKKYSTDTINRDRDQQHDTENFIGCDKVEINLDDVFCVSSTERSSTNRNVESDSRSHAQNTDWLEKSDGKRTDAPLSNIDIDKVFETTHTTIHQNEVLSNKSTSSLEQTEKIMHDSHETESGWEKPEVWLENLVTKSHLERKPDLEGSKSASSIAHMVDDDVTKNGSKQVEVTNHTSSDANWIENLIKDDTKSKSQHSDVPLSDINIQDVFKHAKEHDNLHHEAHLHAIETSHSTHQTSSDWLKTGETRPNHQETQITADKSDDWLRSIVTSTSESSSFTTSLPLSNPTETSDNDNETNETLPLTRREKDEETRTSMEASKFIHEQIDLEQVFNPKLAHNDSAEVFGLDPVTVKPSLTTNIDSDSPVVTEQVYHEQKEDMKDKVYKSMNENKVYYDDTVNVNFNQDDIFCPGTSKNISNSKLDKSKAVSNTRNTDWLTVEKSENKQTDAPLSNIDIDKVFSTTHSFAHKNEVVSEESTIPPEQTEEIMHDSLEIESGWEKPEQWLENMVTKSHLERKPDVEASKSASSIAHSVVDENTANQIQTDTLSQVSSDVNVIENMKETDAKTKNQYSDVPLSDINIQDVFKHAKEHDNEHHEAHLHAIETRHATHQQSCDWLKTGSTSSENQDIDFSPKHSDDWITSIVTTNTNTTVQTPLSVTTSAPAPIQDLCENKTPQMPVENQSEEIHKSSQTSHHTDDHMDLDEVFNQQSNHSTHPLKIDKLTMESNTINNSNCYSHVETDSTSNIKSGTTMKTVDAMRENRPSFDNSQNENSKRDDVFRTMISNERSNNAIGSKEASSEFRNNETVSEFRNTDWLAIDKSEEKQTDVPLSDIDIDKVFENTHANIHENEFSTEKSVRPLCQTTEIMQDSQKAESGWEKPERWLESLVTKSHLERKPDLEASKSAASIAHNVVDDVSNESKVIEVPHPSASDANWIENLITTDGKAKIQDSDVPLSDTNIQDVFKHAKEHDNLHHEAHLDAIQKSRATAQQSTDWLKVREPQPENPVKLETHDGPDDWLTSIVTSSGRILPLTSASKCARSSSSPALRSKYRNTPQLSARLQGLSSPTNRRANEVNADVHSSHTNLSSNQSSDWLTSIVRQSASKEEMMSNSETDSSVGNSPVIRRVKSSVVVHFDQSGNEIGRRISRTEHNVSDELVEDPEVQRRTNYEGIADQLMHSIFSDGKVQSISKKVPEGSTLTEANDTLPSTSETIITDNRSMLPDDKILCEVFTEQSTSFQSTKKKCQCSACQMDSEPNKSFADSSPSVRKDDNKEVIPERLTANSRPIVDGSLTGADSFDLDNTFDSHISMEKVFDSVTLSSQDVDVSSPTSSEQKPPTQSQPETLHDDDYLNFYNNHVEEKKISTPTKTKPRRTINEFYEDPYSDSSADELDVTDFVSGILSQSMDEAAFKTNTGKGKNTLGYAITDTSFDRKRAREEPVITEVESIPRPPASETANIAMSQTAQEDQEQIDKVVLRFPSKRRGRTETQEDDVKFVSEASVKLKDSNGRTNEVIPEEEYLIKLVFSETDKDGKEKPGTTKEKRISGYFDSEPLMEVVDTDVDVLHIEDTTMESRDDEVLEVDVTSESYVIKGSYRIVINKNEPLGQQLAALRTGERESEHFDFAVANRLRAVLLQCIRDRANHENKCELSSRARHLLSGPDPANDIYNQMISNHYDHVKNPTGNVNLCTAENNVCVDLLYERLAAEPNIFQPIKEHFIHYEPLGGRAEIRQAFVNFVRDNWGAEIQEENVAVVPCGNTALDLFTHCVCDEGDILLTNVPTYPRNFANLEHRAKCRLEGVDTNFEYPNLDVYEFQKTYEKHLNKGDVPRGVVLINPHNPLGIVYPKQQVIDLCNWAASRNMYVYVDEAFSRCVYGTRPMDSFLSFAWSLNKPENNLFYWGLSKDFGIPGVRLGFIHTKNPKLKEAYDKMGQMYPVSALAQDFAVKLLNDRVWLSQFEDKKRIRLRAHNQFVTENLKTLGLSFITATAGTFVFTDFNKYMLTDNQDGEWELWQRLVRSGVYLTPGKHTKNPHVGWFRLVFSCPKEELLEGIKRLHQCLGEGKTTVVGAINY